MHSATFSVCSSFVAACPVRCVSAVGAEIPFEKTSEIPASAYGLIAEKRIIWLGEMHGTREGPELLLGLVRLVSSHDKAPPVVALGDPHHGQRLRQLPGERRRDFAEIERLF